MADKIEVEVVRDYWTGDDERRGAGSVIALDVETALKLVEDGIAKTVQKRVPPVPAKASKGE